jgi:2-amino-4-hydroxy-6-hydroxymethyldihydropteridine diphosphokinase
MRNRTGRTNWTDEARARVNQPRSAGGAGAVDPAGPAATPPLPQALAKTPALHPHVPRRLAPAELDVPTSADAQPGAALPAAVQGQSQGTAVGAAPTLPRRAAVGIGANLGNPLATVRDAIAAVRALPGVQGLRASPFYRTVPIEADGPDFINAVVCFDTPLSGPMLLAALQAIERAHGRQRPFRNAPRTLDLDVLLLGDERLQHSDLTVPHPRMHLRAFVLRPLHDLWPDALIPGIGSVAALLPKVAHQAIERLPTPVAP